MAQSARRHDLSWLGLLGVSPLLVLGVVAPLLWNRGDTGRRPAEDAGFLLPPSGAQALVAPLEPDTLTESSLIDNSPHGDVPNVAEIVGARFVEPAPPFAMAVEMLPELPAATGGDSGPSAATPAPQRTGADAVDVDTPPIAPRGESTSQANPLRTRSEVDVTPVGLPGVFGMIEPGVAPMTVVATTPATPDIAMPEESEPGTAIAELPPMLPPVEPARPALADISQLPKLAYIPAPTSFQRAQDAAVHARDLGVMRREQPVQRHEAAARSVQTMPFAWHDPRALQAELDELSGFNAVKSWARETQRVLQEIGARAGRGTAGAQPLLERAEQLALDAAALANRVDDRTLARRMRQANYALTRRIDVWRSLLTIDAAESSPARLAQRQREELSLCLADIEALTVDSAEGRHWRQYLMLDELRAQGRHNDEAVSRELAGELLSRLRADELTREQRRFLASRPVTALEVAMRRATAQPVDLSAVLQHVEQFEQSRLPSDAQKVADDCRALALSPSAGHQELARRLEMHYRNANLRFAVSEKLLNRLVPQREPEMAPVYETVQGVPTVGQSLITSDVALRMVPDANRVRLALEINGAVASYTSSNAGPATFYNRGDTVYTVRKPMELDLTGVRLQPTEVNVHTHSQLRDLETDFDFVPLLGPFVSRIAEKQHEQQMPAAKAELRWKVARKARQKVDSEAVPQLNEASNRLQEKVVRPLQAMELDPTLIAAETTAERISMRLRLAGADQLGSHTARPQAPADSLASLQIHETVINNALARLELDGRTFTLPELRKHIAARFGQTEIFDVDPDNDDVTITFAARDALNVQLQDGQVTIALAVAKMSKSPRAWRDFQVRAIYKPLVNGRTAELARDGIIHLSGAKLNTGAQIALRSVFAKTFSRNSNWTITPEALAQRAEFNDLSITQLSVEDGWMGLALGPKRPVNTARGGLRR